jgi:hypothetical protein
MKIRRINLKLGEQIEIFMDKAPALIVGRGLPSYGKDDVLIEMNGGAKTAYDWSLRAKLELHKQRK